MMYRIKYGFGKKLKKDKQKISKDLNNSKKIKIYIENLSRDPFSRFLNIRKLQPKSENKFRLKIDEYRIIYSIDFGNRVILIHRIGLRKDIYN